MFVFVGVVVNLLADLDMGCLDDEFLSVF